METGGAEIAPPPPQPLAARIAALSGLPIAALRQAWSAARDAPPPKRFGPAIGSRERSQTGRDGLAAERQTP